MIEAVSAKNNVILKFPSGETNYQLERKKGNDGAWLLYTENGFTAAADTRQYAVAVTNLFLDTDVTSGLYQYRCRDITDGDASYEYSTWVRCGDNEPIGYTFGNYKSPEGLWGEILTPDDLRYTYMWGVDFRASNGMPYTDEQIQFHINSALGEIARRLKITIKKIRIACEPERRGLLKGKDYDEEESYYTFKRERIQRNGMITTRKRPVQSVHRLDLLNRHNQVRSLLDAYTLDKTKGMIRFFNRPIKMSDSFRAIQAAIFPYGAETFDSNLFYAIDYVAGFPTSDDVPEDLRAIIAKLCAVEMLNIIGDGLIAGFSSSSLSMDGVSESFSSTQSATSAFYGARIKVYEDEIKNYIDENKMRFGHITLGAL